MSDPEDDADVHSDFDLTPPTTSPEGRDPIDIVRQAYLEHGKKLGSLEQLIDQLKIDTETTLASLGRKIQRMRDEMDGMKQRLDAYEKTTEKP